MPTFHDVVSVSAETDGNADSQDGELPHRNGGLGCSGGTGGPGGVDGGPGADGVADVVGAVGEGGGAGGDDLDEGVGVLDLVGVLFGVGVHTLHTFTLGSTLDTTLGGVNVVVEAVEKTDSEDSRDAFE